MRENFPIEVKFSRRNAGDGVPYAKGISYNGEVIGEGMPSPCRKPGKPRKNC